MASLHPSQGKTIMSPTELHSRTRWSPQCSRPALTLATIAIMYGKRSKHALDRADPVAGLFRGGVGLMVESEVPWKGKEKEEDCRYYLWIVHPSTIASVSPLVLRGPFGPVGTSRRCLEEGQNLPYRVRLEAPWPRVITCLSKPKQMQGTTNLSSFLTCFPLLNLPFQPLLSFSIPSLSAFPPQILLWSTIPILVPSVQICGLPQLTSPSLQPASPDLHSTVFNSLHPGSSHLQACFRLALTCFFSHSRKDYLILYIILAAPVVTLSALGSSTYREYFYTLSWGRDFCSFREYRLHLSICCGKPSARM